MTGADITKTVLTYVRTFPQLFASGANIGTGIGMNIGRVTGALILLTFGGYLFSFLGKYGLLIGVSFGGIMGWLIGEVIGANIGQAVGGPIGAILWSIIGLAFGFILLVNLYGLFKAFNVVNQIMLAQFKEKGFTPKIAIIYIILTLITGIFTGSGLVVGFSSYLTIGFAVSSLPLIGILLYPPLRLKHLKAQYRRQESENLIES